MQENNLTNLTGRVNFFRAFPHALQHILAMFATNLVPILTIASITGQQMPDDLTLALSQNAMLIAGIATLIQSTPIWKIGSGLPIVMGMSFSFLITLMTIALTHGYPGVIGAVIIGGLFEGLLGLTARYWKRLITPVVSATVVTGIGLSLLGTATRSFGGGYADDFGAIHYLVIGFATIASCIIWQIYAKGTKKQLSILLGLTVGYIMSLFFGIIVFPDFSNVKIEKVVDGRSSTGSFKLSGTYFDNNEFHQSLRTVSTFSTNFNFSYSVPLVSPNESSAVTLSASCSRTAKVKTAYTDTLADAEDGVECYNVHISRSTKVAGLSQSLYYAKNPMKAGNSTLTMTHVLVKFYEPYITDDGVQSEIEYSLKTAEIH